MAKLVWQQLLIVGVTALIFFTNLGASHVWDDDEARHGAVALSMYDRGDAIVPMFNGDLSTDKPVLMFWCMLLAMKVFGPTELAVRFFSAVFAVGTSLSTYHLGRMLFRPVVGLWAGLIMATTFYFGFTCRAATPDSHLVFCTTLGLTLFVRGTLARPRSDSGLNSSNHFTLAELLPSRWRDWVFVYAAFAVGILAKGPVGLVLPGVVLGIYALLLWNDGDSAKQQSNAGIWRSIKYWFVQVFHPRRVATVFWAMRPFTAIAAVAVIAVPWYVVVGLQTDWAWPAGFFGRHNLNRFVEAMESHRGPIYYYVPALLAGLFPWSIFLPLSLFRGAQAVFWQTPQRRVMLFLLCWFGVYFCFFSLAATKLPNYLLPAFPPLAVLVGVFLQNWVERPAVESRLWMRTAFVALAVVGLATVVGLYKNVDRWLPGAQVLAFVGLAPLIGGIVGLACMEFGRRTAAVVTTVVAGMGISLSVFGFAQLKVDQYQTSAKLIGAIENHAGADYELTTYRYLPSSLVYYSRRTVLPVANIDDIQAQLQANPDLYLLLSARDLAEFQNILPSDFNILARERRLLRPEEEVVVLGRATRIGSTSRLKR